MTHKDYKKIKRAVYAICICAFIMIGCIAFKIISSYTKGPSDIIKKIIKPTIEDYPEHETATINYNKKW